MKIPALLFLSFSLVRPALCQNVYHFSTGLSVASGSQYGREAIYVDPLAWKLYDGRLNAPAEGAFFGTGKKGDSLFWKRVTSDSLGEFRRVRSLRQGATSFGSPGSVDRGNDYLYLTYTAARKKTALLHIKGNSGVYVNGEPHMGDPYESGWMYIPVTLHKGLNEFYVRGSNVWPELIFPSRSVLINTSDPTLPFIVLKQQNGILKGAVVIINNSGNPISGYDLRSEVAGKEMTTPLPPIPALATRKVIFSLNAEGVTQKGAFPCHLTLSNHGKEVDTQSVQLHAVEVSDHYSSTFVSAIDGSLQYYAVTPQLNGTKPGAALFLSVHGAGVEAIGQAQAYRPKDWGTLVAATNRRPRGFNWEDWGRLDAMEVLDIAQKRFSPDPTHIYLTGHSMGGHGTWFLGATYPDKWAAIGACSGYPTLKEYGSADGKIPDSSQVPIEQVLLRAGNQSDVPKLAYNYKSFGVYILHGDSDKVVPVMYAREMRQLLGTFHKDFSYHEVPGAEHWYGNQSVDWDPLFAFFKWHSLAPDSAVNEIDFTTASPGISSGDRWASVIQQMHPLQYSRIRLSRDKKKNLITGSADNVLLMTLALGNFGSHAQIKITLDNTSPITYTTLTGSDTLYMEKRGNAWAIATQPAASEKGPLRYGTFKEAFNNRMVFVYGTGGSSEEVAWSYNKARFDAESWYYRGNGAVDIISDKDYIPQKYKGRNVILYGNSSTNGAWKILLQDCPIQVSTGEIKVGDQTWQGSDLGAYFIWPQSDPVTSVGVIAGTGIKGMNAANANQYFAGGSGFPDYMVFRLDMLISGSQGVLAAGFFDNQWKLE